VLNRRQKADSLSSVSRIRQGIKRAVADAGQTIRGGWPVGSASYDWNAAADRAGLAATAKVLHPHSANWRWNLRFRLLGRHGAIREGNQNVRRCFARFSGTDCRAGDRDRRSIGRPYAQTLPPLTGAKAHPLVEASVTERDAYYSAQRSRTREALPRVIFIPGILGSVIRECGADDTGCKDIWGQRRHSSVRTT
jgi:hypothetical protein